MTCEFFFPTNITSIIFLLNILYMLAQTTLCYETSVIFSNLALEFLSSLWVTPCIFNESFRPKRLSQLKHAYGFSPVCVLVWTCRWYLSLKHLRQTWHWYVFSWTTFLQECRLLLLTNVLLQVKHSNDFVLLFLILSENLIYQVIVD